MMMKTLVLHLTFAAVMAAPLLAQANAEARQKASIALVEDFWASVWNPPYDHSAIDRLCTEDFILTNAGRDIRGRDAFKEWVSSFSGMMSDIRLTSHEMFANPDGTRVVSRWSVTAKNRGLFGTEPDMQPITFTGIAIWEIRDGRLAHNWVERSAHELHQQLTK
jgi:predicted ester cyclase